MVAQREYALPLAEAYELITDGDRRPLLVLRECERCKGTDHALLNQSMDNEQTVLLARWFKCVKLPPNVLDDKHPFYNLFRREQEGERIPHLYFCSHDGSNKQALPGDQTQAQLWEVMYSILEREYDGNAKKRVKELRALLSQFDSVDALAKELKARMDRELDKRGPDSPKLKQMQDDLDELGEKRQKLLDEEKKLRELPLVETEAGTAK